MAGRVLGVSSRPLLLLVAINYTEASTAEAVAIAFLLASVALMAIGADSHRRFYTQRFSGPRTVEEHVFHEYVGTIAIVTALGVGFVSAAAIWTTGSWTFAAACALYFLSEKMQDEVLRFRLFDKAFGAWGRAVVGRTIAQFVLLGLLLLITRTAMPPTMAIVALALGNLVIFLPQLPSRRIARTAAGPSDLAGLARRSVAALFAARLYWALMLATAGVGYIDRLITLVFDTAILPLFALIVMAFSVVQMSIDFFYISRHRGEFLGRSVTVRSTLGDRAFLASLVGGIVVASVASIVVLQVSRNGETFPSLYVLLIAAIQIAVALAGIPREISYWKHTPDRLLYVEGVFWALFALGLAASLLTNAALGVLLAVAAATTLVRLGIHVWLAGLAPNDPREARSPGEGPWISGS